MAGLAGWREEIDLLGREWMILKTLAEDLQDETMILDLWRQREMVEALNHSFESYSTPEEFPPLTPDIKPWCARMWLWRWQLDNHQVQAAIKKLPENERNDIIQEIKPKVDPIESALWSCGLASLQTGANLIAIEEALLTLGLNLTDSDDLRRGIVREAALKKLADIGVGAPGKLLDAALQSAATPPSEAAGLELFTDPEPWPAVVEGAKLLNDIVSLIRRYVIVPVDSANAAALFRAVEKLKPVMLIDDADTFLHEKDDLRGVINSGHRRSSAFVVRTVGDEHEPKTFSTWGAKAIAAIGKLSGTMEDRSLIIAMKRRAPGERAEKFRTATYKSMVDPLRRQAFRWACDSIPMLQKITPEEPSELNDRARITGGRC